MTMVLQMCFALVAILLAVLAGCFTVGAYRYGKNARKGDMFGRATAAVLCTVMAVGLVANSGVFGVFTNRDTTVFPDGAPPEFTAAGELEPESEQRFEPLDLVDLTADQIAEFMKDYTRQFSDASLSGERAVERKAAIAVYGKQFETPVNFPRTEWLDKLDGIKSGKIGDEELLQLWEKTLHVIVQDIISNPVSTRMWLLGFAKIPEIMENNAIWITPALESYNEYYSRVKGELDADGNELPYAMNALLVRSADDPKIYLVTDQQVEIAVKIATILIGNFSFNGITTKTSIHNWEHNGHGEASYSSVVESKKQESLEATELVSRYKNGDPKISIGINLYDQRLEIFPLTEPQPVKQPEPVKPVDPPKPEPKPAPVEPKPTPQPDPDYELTIKYVYEDGSTAAPTYTKWLQPRASYSRNSPNIPGYTPSQATVSGKMPARPHTETVTYYRNEAAKADLLIHYKYKDTGLIAADDYRATVAVGTKFDVPSPEIEGYTADKKIISGTMTEAGYETTVYYTRNERNLHIDYFYEGTRTPVVGAPAYDGKYEYDKPYSVNSPFVQGYTPDRWVVSGTMPDHDVYEVVYYSKDYVPPVNPPKDGEGWKDPADDPVNNGNGDNGGGNNQSPDGDGVWQPTTPPVEDLPGEDQSGDTTPTPPPNPDDDHDSSGTGGEDHPIEDGNGGATDGGDPPPLVENPPPDDTIGQDTDTGEITSPGDEGSNGGAIPEP